MKIAIHHRKGGFSDRWIDYCKMNKIAFKIVNAYDSDIINQVQDCDVFMWHHHHGYFKDNLAAKPILFALEQSGIKVFPDFNTGWHFDDKVAQKYLLEAIKAPLVPSYVFYDKKDAIHWAKSISYPKVFKLKGGAGSSNVILIKNVNSCLQVINKAFNKGISQYNAKNDFKDKWRKFKETKNPMQVFKGIARFFIAPSFARLQHREKGYVYFQEFIPNNESDTRIIVIKNKAFAIKRGVREGDFRASGSGKIIYDEKEINIEAIKTSFEINNIIKSQCVAFDYIFLNGKPLIVEISYGFAVEAYDHCPGYWTSDLQWHSETFNPQIWMIENLIKLVENE